MKPVNLTRQLAIALIASWYFLCFAVGLFGGFAAAYIIGLPLALLAPIPLVRVAKYRGKGVPTLLTYCAGLGTVPVWLIASQTILEPTSHFPTEGTIAIAGGLVALALVMALGARLPVVRARTHSHG